MYRLFIILILIAPFTITAAPTLPATQACWVAPTQNVDGTVLTDLAGFKLYCGATPGVYTTDSNISDPLETCQTFIAAGLPDGAHYCAATAYDTALQESVYSNEINFTLAGGVVPLTNVPAAPFSLGVQ